MATKAQTPDQTPATTADLKTLQEQKRLLDQQIKDARDALPQRTKLEVLIERQDSNLTKWVPVMLANRVTARVALGQPLDEATEDVFAAYRAAVAQIIANAAIENDEAQS